VEAQNPIASASKTAGTVSGTSAVRPWIYDLDFGYSATPADNALAFYLQRFTAPGTNTAYTPSPLDPGDPAATAPCGITNTVEPTYTAGKILWHSATNQRATHRFNFDPDGPLVIPATASNGIGWYGVHASFTGNLDSMVYFAE
jgi:hypothetical protein